MRAQKEEHMRSLSWRVKPISLFVPILGASLLFQMLFIIPRLPVNNGWTHKKSREREA